MNSERYKQNENAPQVRFIRKHGRVIPIFSGNKKGVKPRVAADLVGEQLSLMKLAVDNAEAGKRVHLGYGTDHEVRGFKSSFPDFYGKLHFENKKDFNQTITADKNGPKQLRLFETAVHDLSHGKDYGLGMPKDRSMRFKVATRQVFDNQGVVFRKMHGQIVPLRVGKQTEHTKKVMTEEPWL